VPSSRARNNYAHVRVYGHDDDDSHSGYERTTVSSVGLLAMLNKAVLVGSIFRYSSKGVQLVQQGRTMSLGFLTRNRH
jgi:hypothetical protein